MMPYVFGLELTAPQNGSQQCERELRMGRLAARLFMRRTARAQQRPRRP